jgi:tetratricopeptide (TPR) repeat protein
VRPTVLLALFLCAACPAGGAPALPPPPASAELDAAVVELFAEHHGRASAASSDARAAGEYGLALEANGFPREAAAAFARAAELDPAEPGWRYHRAVVNAAAGETDAARAELEALATELPDAAWVRQRLGELLLALGDASAARVHFERVVELGSTGSQGGVEGFTGLGACELALGQADEAVRALERAVALEPGYKSARYQLGLAYRELGRVAEAERELALGQLAQPRPLADPLSDELRRLTVGPTARLQLALQYLEAGRNDRAVRMLEALLERAPGDVVVLNNLAIALQRTGELERAQALLTQAAEREPETATTWINLALLALDRNTSARALEHAERAVALAPESAKAHLARARVFLRQRKTAEAVRDLEACLRLDARELEALALLGETWLAAGSAAEARAAFARLRVQAPHDARAALGLARAAHALGEDELARSELAAARALAPEHPELGALERLLGSER